MVALALPEGGGTDARVVHGWVGHHGPQPVRPTPELEQVDAKAERPRVGDLVDLAAIDVQRKVEPGLLGGPCLHGRDEAVVLAEAASVAIELLDVQDQARPSRIDLHGRPVRMPSQRDPARTGAIGVHDPDLADAVRVAWARPEVRDLTRVR